MASPPLRRLVPIQPRPLESSDASTSGSRVALEAAASAAKDAQRRRHRLAVKRAYHARLNGLSALREQERALEAQYEQLVQQRNGDGESGSDPKALYLQLLDLRRRLERENTALREVAAQHEQFQTRTRLAALDDGILTLESDRETDENESSASDVANPLTRSPTAAPAATIKPLTTADCFQVIHDTWPQVLAFRRGSKSLLVGSEVFGWTHRYRFPPADTDTTAAPLVPPVYKLQYSISKIFPHLSAFELSQRGWEIMTTQRHYQALHSSTMTSHMHFVQRVDNDNLVFLRILQRGAQTTVFKTLLLTSRFQVGNGVLTIFRGLDPARVLEDHIAPKTLNSHWLEMFSWTYFEDLADGTSVKFEFGGEMRHSSNDNARFWMMEVLLMALRWENMAVGSLFKLTNG